MSSIAHPPYICGQPMQPESNDLDVALGWFVRYRGGMAAEETRALGEWLDAKPQHRAAFAHWQSEWTSLDALPASGIDALRSQINKDKRSERVQNSPWRQWWRGLARGPMVTAFASVLVFVGAGWLAWTGWSQRVLFEQTVASQRGQQMEVQLPDTSQVRLDTSTRLQVTYRANRRVVHLTEGQAMFQVQPNADKPFDVLAGPLRVTVVGTRFSVRYTPALPGASGVFVSVESGRVRVSQQNKSSAESAAGGDTVELGAGQQLVATADGRLGPVTQVPPADVALWRQSRVSFYDRPLAEVIAEFERYGDTHLAIPDPAVAAMGISGTFDLRRLDTFARVLPQALPVQLRRNGAVTEIIAKP